MKVLVAVKRVIDPYIKIRIKSDGQGVETQNVKHVLNPFDEIALEEAIRLLEKNVATEVLVVSIGALVNQETLRHALALGATRGMLVETDTSLCSLSIAKVLAHLVKEENIDLVFMGKQSIDGDNNQTPQMLASLLNWPQATNASSIKCVDNGLMVQREVDGGIETLALDLPAVVSADLRLNEPRYASLPNIMKAKQKSLTIIQLSTLPIVIKNHIEVISVSAPPVRKVGVRVSSVTELVDKLKHEAKVL